jgi:Na+/proline symporter
MNQLHTRIKENRYLEIYNKKIRQIKTGVIIVIMFVIVVVAAETINEIYHNWIDLVIQKYYLSYQEGAISSDSYYSLKESLEFKQDFFQWISLIIAGLGKILLNIGFLLIIVGFLSITTDRSFNKRLRRISLILAVVLLIFVLYLVFEILFKEVQVITYYYPPFFSANIS